MKKLLKRINEINNRHWKMVLEYNPSKYKKQYDAYMTEMETAIQQYTISKCDCPEDETTGTMTEEVCNICGRVEK